MSLLSLVAFAAAVTPCAEAMMRPSSMAQGVVTPTSLVEDLVGEEDKAVARRTCAADSNHLEPASTDTLSLLAAGRNLDAKAHDPDAHAQSKGNSTGRHVRACPETRARVSDLETLVLPKYKLAFCYIPKVACSEFTDLFNSINGAPASTLGALASSLGFSTGYYTSSYLRQLGSMKTVTKENGWKFAAFTRDPALRYLSAFGDTCAVPAQKALIWEHDWSCCGSLVNAAESMEIQKEELQARVRMDRVLGLPDDEQHWASQKEILEHCGGENPEKFMPENLDYWGLLSGDVTSQVKDMLKMVNFENDTLVERFFPKSNIRGHHGILPGEPSDYINDLELLEGIVKIYEGDYRAFPGIGCAFTEPLLAKLRAEASTGKNASSI